MEPEQRRRKYILEGIVPAPIAPKTQRAELVELLVNDILDAENAARLTYDPEYMASLKQSILDIGLTYPLTVFPFRGKYQVLDGQRRLMCIRDLGWHTVRCLVFPDENLAIEAIRLHTNQEHAHMTAWEESVYFTEMCNRVGLSFEELCKFVRKSENYVSDRLLLQQAQPETQEALRNGLISLGVAKQLRRLKSREWELYYLDQCLRSGSGVTVLTGWINGHLQRGGLEIRTISTNSGSVSTTPPLVQELTCVLCNRPSNGRVLLNVWVHADELATVQQMLTNVLTSLQEEGKTGEQEIVVKG